MKRFGQIGYEGYCEHAGGKSLVSGQALPRWEQVKPEIQAAWEAGARLVLVRALEREWTAVGDGLPPRLKRVLVVTTQKYTSPTVAICNGLEWFCDHGHRVTVTHWQSLPGELTVAQPWAEERKNWAAEVARLKLRVNELTEELEERNE